MEVNAPQSGTIKIKESEGASIRYVIQINGSQGASVRDIIHIKGMEHVPNIFMSFDKDLFFEVINILI